jgi:succinate dehydrogenase / fumarate reductase flavoprotein subunit
MNHPLLEHDVLVISARGAGAAAIEAARARRQGRRPVQVAAWKGAYGDGGRRLAALANVATATAGACTSPTRCATGHLNNWRMTELHAKSSDRVRELEAWGAVFDRTADGKFFSATSAAIASPPVMRRPPGLEMIDADTTASIAA